MNVLQRYGGVAAVVIEWLLLLTCIYIAGMDTTEPASQYGYYSQTRVLFALAFTFASLTYYLFSRLLDRYWRYTSLLSAIAGLAATTMAWVPYQPGVYRYVIDAHNIAITISMILYALPMIFIGYSNHHRQVARYSHVGFFVLMITGGASLVARSLGYHILIIQMVSIASFQIWILLISMIIIRDTKPPKSRQLQTL